MQNDKRNLIDKYKNKTELEIKADLMTTKLNWSIAIENLSHDFNIGTIVRNANAFNAKNVYIIGNHHWNKRGAMSTDHYLDMHQFDDALSFIKYCHLNNILVYAIDNNRTQKMIGLSNFVFPNDREFVIVFGSESSGLSNEIINKCDDLIYIEQFGSTRSINVGVASGIIMYQIVNQLILSRA